VYEKTKIKAFEKNSIKKKKKEKIGFRKLRSETIIDNIESKYKNEKKLRSAQNLNIVNKLSEKIKKMSVKKLNKRQEQVKSHKKHKLNKKYSVNRFMSTNEFIK
jgi:hypothetical protein